MKRYLSAYINLYRTRRSALVTFCVTMLLLSAAYGIVQMAVSSVEDVVTIFSDKRDNATDAARQINVNSFVNQANSHEQNANQFSTIRQVDDARAQAAQAIATNAAVNANLTREPARRARLRYEKTRRLSVDDAPALSDARICSELAARNINFSGCPR